MKRNAKRVLGGLAVFGLSLWHSSVSLAAPPPDGWIVWCSNRSDDRYEIYLMKADGTGDVARLTTTGGRDPEWSPDGRWISYEEPVLPNGRARVVRPDKSEDKLLFDGTPLFWMHDNSGLACRRGEDVYLVNPDTGQSRFLVSRNAFSRMVDMSWEPRGLSRDGRWLVTWTDRYSLGYEGSNGFFKATHAVAILDLENTDDLWFFGSGVYPTMAPGGDWVYDVAADSPTQPDIFRLNVGDRADRSSYQPVVAYADLEWGHEYYPRISTDGIWLTYSASVGCHDGDAACNFELFLHRLDKAIDSRFRLSENPANDQWAHMYVGPLWNSGEPSLTSVTVTTANKRILPGRATELRAFARDQYGNPFPTAISWSAAGGGALSPVSSSAELAEYLARFLSNGAEGTFLVTAAADGVRGTTPISVASAFVQPFRVNCGSNQFDVPGWEREDLYASGGHDWVNGNTVGTDGVANAAPADVYRSVRHRPPHSYHFPVTDGAYTLRLHFADAYTGRSMNYFVEGEQILKDFDVASEAGGTNRALVKDFAIRVSDGDGLQIEVTGGSEDDDAFEAGIEILCPQELAFCDNVCVRLESSPAHCGECSRACRGGETCEDSECRPNCGAGTVRSGDRCLPEGIQGCGCQAAQMLHQTFWLAALLLLRRRAAAPMMDREVGDRPPCGTGNPMPLGIR